MRWGDGEVGEGGEIRSWRCGSSRERMSPSFFLWPVLPALVRWELSRREERSLMSELNEIRRVRSRFGLPSGWMSTRASPRKLAEIVTRATGQLTGDTGSQTLRPPLSEASPCRQLLRGCALSFDILGESNALGHRNGTGHRKPPKARN